MKALLYRTDGAIKELEVPYGTVAFRYLSLAGKETICRRANDPPHNGIAHFVQYGLTADHFLRRAQAEKMKGNYGYAAEMQAISDAMCFPNVFDVKPTIHVNENAAKAFPIPTHVKELEKYEDAKLSFQLAIEQQKANDAIATEMQAILDPYWNGQLIKGDDFVVSTNSPNWIKPPFPGLVSQSQTQYISDGANSIEDRCTECGKHHGHLRHGEWLLEEEKRLAKEARSEPVIVGERASRMIDIPTEEEK